MKKLIACLSFCALIGTSTSVVLAESYKILRVGVANHIAIFAPGADHSNNGNKFYVNAFNTLVGKNPLKSEVEYKPELATSWKVINPRLIELKIRQGVKFHNGDPMTIDDVVFSLQRMFDPSFVRYISRSDEYFENMYRAEKVDEQTLRVYSKKDEPIMELLLNVQQSMIVPMKYIMGLTGHPEVDEASDYEAFHMAPVGTGPYKVKSFMPGEETVYERFNDYWGKKAPFEQIVLKRISELSSRITALVNNEVDIIDQIPPDQLAAINSNPNYKTVGAITPLFHVVIYNTSNPKMTQELRLALNLCIDRKLLSEALWGGKALVPNTHTYAQYGAYYQPDIMTWEYNPEKGKQLIKENGLEGTTVRYDTDPVYYTNGVVAAQAIGEMWAECGIKMKLNVQKKWTGNDPTFEARNWSNPMYFADPAGSYGTMWSPTGARPTAQSGSHSGQVNVVGCGSCWVPKEGYNEMWDKFRYEYDVKKRNAAYKEIMDYIKVDPPLIALYQPFESYGMRSDIEWIPYPGHSPYVMDFTAGRITVGN